MIGRSLVSVVISGVSVCFLGCAPQEDYSQPIIAEAQGKAEQPAEEAGKDIALLKQEEFEAFVANPEIPSLVVFGAPWCFSCQDLEPDLRMLAKEYEGRAQIAKVNIDQAKDLAAKFRVSGTPFLLFFNQGKPVVAMPGRPPKDVIAERLDSQLAAADDSSAS